MLIKEEILKELMELSPVLAGMEKRNPYSVPTGYFEGLDEHLLHWAQLNEHTDSQSDKSIINSRQVPDGYFDSLADTILEKIKKEQSPTAEDELRQLSPVLYRLEKVNVYQVPAGYFDSLEHSLLHKVLPGQAVVVPLSRNSFNRGMKYAAAAMIVGLMGMFSFFQLTGSDNNNKLDAIVKKGMEYASNNKFDEILNKTSDEAIIHYLDKTTDEADAIQMVARVDQSQLPSEEELMSDEKLMDDLLNEIDTKTTTN